MAAVSTSFFIAIILTLGTDIDAKDLAGLLRQANGVSPAGDGSGVDFVVGGDLVGWGVEDVVGFV